jgi:CBS-domain-containing membrane protein
VNEHQAIHAVLAGVGAGLAIAAMEWLSNNWHYPLAIIPFATSIVLVIALPDAPPAQPRALVGGHVLSTLIGLMVVSIAGPQPWAAAVAVGLAVFAMGLTDTMHPPAGIDPLLVVTAGLPWWFLIVPVLTGALLLLAFAFIWHRIVHRRRWPAHWI